MIRIKICGVTTPADVDLVADAGADAVGFNFHPKSPRYVDPKRAEPLVRALPPFLASVGVFVEPPMRQAVALAFQLGLRTIQTYNAPPDDDPFPFAHLPAFRVKDVASLQAIRQYVDSCAAFGRKPSAVLVDSFVPGEVGGTGKVAPWELLVGFDPGVPLVLAGGLTPDNVAEAIRLVKPCGVDVASGVESAPGKKDPEKVRAFVKNARAVGQLS
jgi:phosphoribosylanthranilate isomerase